MKPRAPLPDRLSHAEFRLLRTRRDLDRLEAALDQSNLPAHYWNEKIQQRVRFVESRYARAQRDYDHAWTAAHPVIAARNARPDTPPPVAAAPPPPLPIPPELYHQSFEIHLKNGTAVTKLIDKQNASWLTDPPYPETALFCRQLQFMDGAIPEHYAAIMRRHGIPAEPPPRALFLRYHRDSFLALCRHEIESASEHLSEGEPIEVWPLI